MMHSSNNSTESIQTVNSVSDIELGTVGTKPSPGTAARCIQRNFRATKDKSTRIVREANKFLETKKGIRHAKARTIETQEEKLNLIGVITIRLIWILFILFIPSMAFFAIQMIFTSTLDGQMTYKVFLVWLFAFCAVGGILGTLNDISFYHLGEVLSSRLTRTVWIMSQEKSDHFKTEDAIHMTHNVEEVKRLLRSHIPNIYTYGIVALGSLIVIFNHAWQLGLLSVGLLCAFAIRELIQAYFEHLHHKELINDAEREAQRLRGSLDDKNASEYLEVIQLAEHMSNLGFWPLCRLTFLRFLSTFVTIATPLCWLGIGLGIVGQGSISSETFLRCLFYFLQLQLAVQYTEFEIHETITNVHSLYELANAIIETGYFNHLKHQAAKSGSYSFKGKQDLIGSQNQTLASPSSFYVSDASSLIFKTLQDEEEDDENANQQEILQFQYRQYLAVTMLTLVPIGLLVGLYFVATAGYAQNMLFGSCQPAKVTCSSPDFPSHTIDVNQTFTLSGGCTFNSKPNEIIQTCYDYAVSEDSLSDEAAGKASITVKAKFVNWKGQGREYEGVIIPGIIGTNTTNTTQGRRLASSRNSIGRVSSNECVYNCAQKRTFSWNMKVADRRYSGSKDTISLQLLFPEKKKTLPMVLGRGFEQGKEYSPKAYSDDDSEWIASSLSTKKPIGAKIISSGRDGFLWEHIDIKTDSWKVRFLPRGRTFLKCRGKKSGCDMILDPSPYPGDTTAVNHLANRGKALEQKLPKALNSTRIGKEINFGSNNIKRVDYEGFTVWIDCDIKGAVAFYYNAYFDWGDNKRAHSFKRDPVFDKACQQKNGNTYKEIQGNSQYSGKYDRGHLVPANHLDWSKKAITDSNYMTNILPQAARMNRGAWLKTEEIIECQRDVEALRVAGGAVYADHTAETIQFKNSHGLEKHPIYFWKVIQGSEELHPQTSTLAFWIPNTNTNVEKKDLDKYIVSLDTLEKNLDSYGVKYSFTLSSDQMDVKPKLWDVPKCDLG